jgi:cysteine desulfurase / selenocysteine lyase
MSAAMRSDTWLVSEVAPVSAMDFDLERARADTPGVLHVTHLNNAGASLAPRQVIEATVRHLELESLIGPYEAAERSELAVKRAHEAVAELIGCTSQEVALFDSATRAWGTALSSLPLGAGDRVLVSPVEYGSNHISLLHLARRTGVVPEVVPVDATGVVSVTRLLGMLDERVKLIAITHIPMHDGMVNPVALIGRVARANGIPFLVDACQSVGQVPVDVREIGCDLLVGCGRKYLRGPRGTGFLYARRELAEQLSPPVPGLDGVEWLAGDYRLAPAARRFETWEANYASRIGLGVAVDYALEWGVERTWRRIQRLADDVRSEVQRIPRVRIEDRGRERCGIIALSLQGREAASVRAELCRTGINTWVCLPNAACVDMETRGARSLLRVSVHYYNSTEELERFCWALETLVIGRSVHSF